MAKKGNHLKAMTSSAPMADRRWEVQDAVQTLKRAEQIKADPKLHAAAKAHAKTEAVALQKIARKK